MTLSCTKLEGRIKKDLITQKNYEIKKDKMKQVKIRQPISKAHTSLRAILDAPENSRSLVLENSTPDPVLCGGFIIGYEMGSEFFPEKSCLCFLFGAEIYFKG